MQPGDSRAERSNKRHQSEGKQGIVFTFNPSTWGKESMSSRPAWPTQQVPGQPGLHTHKDRDRETLSQTLAQQQERETES